MFLAISCIQYYSHHMLNYDDNSVSLIHALYIYESPFEFNNGTIDYTNDDPEPQNLAIFKQASDQKKVQTLNLTININSPVSQLSLFAQSMEGSALKLFNSNITFILNAKVEAFVGITSVLTNVTVINTNLSLQANQQNNVHGSVSLIAAKLGTLKLLNSSISANVNTNLYYGMAIVVTNDSVLDQLNLTGTINAEQAFGLAKNLSASLRITNMNNTQRISGSTDNITMGMWQILNTGSLTIENSTFNAILESGVAIGGRVFYGESDGAATLINVSGMVTGNWQTWCGEQCSLDVSKLNNVRITSDTLKSLKPKNGVLAIYHNNDTFNLNNTRIVLEAGRITQQDNFSIFSGYNYFYNITLVVKELTFTNNNVGLLYHQQDGCITIDTVNISANVSSNGAIGLLSIDAMIDATIRNLTVNQTIINSNQRAALFFNTTNPNIAINAQNVVFGNATQVHGKGGIGGLITECQGLFYLYNSSLDFAVVSNDIADSSAFVYQSTNCQFGFFQNNYTVRGIYTTTQCVKGACKDLPMSVDIPRFSVTNPTFVNSISSSQYSCIFDNLWNYNTTVISTNYTYTDSKQGHSIFCSAPIFYNITIQNSQVVAPSAIYAAVFTNTRLNTYLYNILLDNVSLVAGTNGGLLVGSQSGYLYLSNVMVKGTVQCNDQMCGGLIGQSSDQISGDSVSFYGTVYGKKYVATIVGNMGSNDITLTNTKIYASVASSQESYVRGVCQTSLSSLRPSCNVQGDIQVSGMFNGCPGPQTSYDSNICQAFVLKVSPTNFEPVEVKINGVAGNKIVYKKSGLLPESWNLNNSIIEFMEGNYQKLNNFSFFGQTTTIFKNIKIRGGQIRLGNLQGFAGFIYATDSANQNINFENCSISVQVLGQQGSIAGYIFANFRDTQIQNSQFSGKFNGGCHEAGFIYLHAGGDLTMNSLTGENFIINGSDNCPSWNNFPFASGSLIGHLNNNQHQSLNKNIKVTNIKLQSSSLNGTGYVGGVIASIDGNYDWSFEYINVNNVNVHGVVKYPFGAFAGKVTGSGNNNILNFTFDGGKTSLYGDAGNYTHAGLFVGNTQISIKTAHVTLKPASGSAFGTCPYGYSSDKYYQNNQYMCNFIQNNIKLSSTAQVECIDNEYYQSSIYLLKQYSKICYLAQFKTGDFNNSYIDVEFMSVIGDDIQRQLNGPFIFTFFPPSYTYFSNIVIKGTVQQNKNIHSYAFAYFIPYAVNAPVTFINCTHKEENILRSVNVNPNTAYLGIYVVVVENSAYFYCISAYINFFTQAPADKNVYYGGLIVTTTINSKTYFSNLDLTMRSASDFTFDASGQQALLMQNNSGECLIKSGLFKYINPSYSFSHNKFAVTLNPKCDYKTNFSSSCDGLTDTRVCRFV